MSQLHVVRLSAITLLALLVSACGGTESAGPAWTALPPATEGPAVSADPAASGQPAESGGPSSAAPSGGTGGDTAQLTIGTDTGAALQFDPATASVPAGSTVQLTFENRSTVPHNLTFEEPINEATATIVDPGASEPLEFPAPDPGDYVFVCTLHPGMEGTLTVE